MNVKLDTKEKFTVITPEESTITANMTARIDQLLRPYLTKPVPHIVLNMEKVSGLSPEAGAYIAALQQEFYEQNVSMVICCLQSEVENQLEQSDLLEVMNTTPTESEAWDIMHMEEIERELLDDENF